MDVSLLKVLGQIAGVAGIALGVLLIVFREVIRKNIFPNLERHQAYRIIQLIITLTFAIAVLGIGAWVYTQTMILQVPMIPSQDPAKISQAAARNQRLMRAWEDTSYAQGNAHYETESEKQLYEVAFKKFMYALHIAQQEGKEEEALAAYKEAQEMFEHLK